MKNQLRLVFFLIVGGLTASARVAPPAQIPISVTIKAPSPEVKLGSELKLDVSLTNISDEQVDLTTWRDDFRVDVFDSQRKAVGKVEEHGESATNPKTGNFVRPIQRQDSSQGLQMAPHLVLRFEMDLSKQFDLSKPGKYTVQATRMYGKVPVKSNVITITVVP